MSLIPMNMHGTHERENGIRPAGFTVFAANSGYKAYDIYNADLFGHEINQANINREELWLQIKDRPIYSYKGNLLRCDHQSTCGADKTKTELYIYTNLSLLKTDYIDAYTGFREDYNPEYYKNYSFEDYLKKWQNSENLYQKGLVKYLGLEFPHFTQVEYLANNAKIKPSIFQIEARKPIAQLLKFALENCMIAQLIQFQKLLQNVKNDDFKAIADAHQISRMQVLEKLLIELGIQVLTSANREKYLLENLNLNFELSSIEIKQLIKSGIFKQEADEILAIYEQLQTSELVTLNDIYTRLTNCNVEYLAEEIATLSKFIPRLDPTTLAEIMANQSPKIIDYLIQYNANFTEITSIAYAKIVQNYGTDYIEILKDKLNIPAAKLVLATLNPGNRSHFDKLINEADLSQLTKKDIEAIIETYPDIFEKLLNSDVDAEKLLLPSAMLNDKTAFDKLFSKVDLKKIYSIDVVKIINKMGLKIIDKLAELDYDFLNLTIADLDNLTEQYDLEVIYKLAEHNVSPTILLPALKLGGIEVFNELAAKLDMSLLTYPDYLRQIIEHDENTLNTLIKHKEPLYKITSYSRIFPQEIFVKIFDLMIQNNIDNKDGYGKVFVASLDFLIRDSENLPLAERMIHKVTNLKSYQIVEVISKTLTTEDTQWLDFFKPKFDLLTLESYSKNEIFENAVASKVNSETLLLITKDLELKLPHPLFIPCYENNDCKISCIILPKYYFGSMDFDSVCAGKILTIHDEV